MANLPYASSITAFEKVLKQIKVAAVPDKFSQDFVATKLNVKGGAGRAVIPTIKKMGLVSADGTPTELYKQYRNPSKTGQTIAKCMRKIFNPLFERNEYVYDLDNKDLKGLIVEVTGSDHDSEVVRRTVATFQALKEIASFENDRCEIVEEEIVNDEYQSVPSIPINKKASQDIQQVSNGISLSYTINLNLPPTKDIEVFNAIFKSLKQHLLQE